MSARHCEKSGCSWINEPALKSQCPNVKLGEWKIRPRQPGSFSMTDMHCVSRIGILISLIFHYLPLSSSLFARVLRRRVTQLRCGRALSADGRIWSTAESAAHARQRDKGTTEPSERRDHAPIVGPEVESRSPHRVLEKSDMPREIK